MDTYDGKKGNIIFQKRETQYITKKTIKESINCVSDLSIFGQIQFQFLHFKNSNIHHSIFFNVINFVK